MNTVNVILPENIYLTVSLSFVGVVVFIRIIRWVLDILP